MWEINNLSQLLGFIYSAALGGIYCLVYDVLRALRAEIKFGTAAVFLSDILYSLVCAAACFCFLLAVTAGEPRMFVFAGAAVGFLVIRLTLSKLWFFILSLALRAARFVFKRISVALGRIFPLIGAGIGLLGKKAKKIYDLSSNTLKKHLKKQ